MRIISTVSLAMALCAAAPAFTQDAPAQRTANSSVDPASLAEARLVVIKLVPPGTYKKIMSSAMAPMMDNMSGSLKALPLKQLAELGGLDARQAAALDRIDIEQVMAIYDPHWRERTNLTMHAMFDAMGDFFATLEPELREAIAKAYASQFTLDDLRDLNRYFATPTGAKFAGRYMTIMTDPAMADEMKAMMPKMMAQMPRFIEAAQKAAAKLPPPRRLESLTAQEKAKLAKALGVDESKLHDPKSPT